MVLEPWVNQSVIQDYGYLICTDSLLQISDISSSINILLDNQASYYLNKNISIIINTFSIKSQEEIFEYLKNIKNNNFYYKTFQVKIKCTYYKLSIFKSNNVIYFEFELKEKSYSPNLNINTIASKNTKEIFNIWSILVEHIASVLQYDRSLILKVSNKNGAHIIAENKNKNITFSTLSLHFDKEFMNSTIINYYAESGSRFLWDILPTGAELIHSPNLSQKPIHSQLLSLPDIHIKFLEKIGAKSALIVPIIINNKMWGLSVNINYEKKWLGLEERILINQMVQVVGISHSNNSKQKLLKYYEKSKEIEQDLKDILLSHDCISTVLVENLGKLCQIVNADGIALLEDEHISTYGLSPTNSQIRKIINYLKKNKDKNLFKDHNFALKHDVEDIDILPFAGLMALRINKFRNNYLLWFRKEAPKKIINSYKITSAPINYKDIQYSFRLKPLLKTASRWSENEVIVVSRIHSMIQKVKLIKSEEQENVNSELIALNHELEMLSFTLSHDIKNPLSIITLGSKMLMSKPNLQADLKDKWLLTIFEAAKSIENLTKSSITFGQAKQFKIRKKPIIMSPIIQKIINEATVIYPNKNTQIIIGKMHSVQGEKNLLYQVFTNIIHNSFKYSSTKDSPRIEIFSTIDNNMIVYHVKDNGIGIPSSEIPLVFEIFNRSSNSSSFDGSGVGLAMVKRILDRLEAKAEITSTECEGTCVSVYFNA